MRRKLSLMLALVMILTVVPVIPSYAATSNRTDRIVSVSHDSVISGGSAPKLIIKNNNQDVRPTVATPEVFELKLGPNAAWTYSDTTWTNIGNAEVFKRTDDILEVRALSSYGVKDAVIEIPMLVAFEGAEEGAQEVQILPLNSAVTGGKYTYATVGANDVTFRVEKKIPISRASGDNQVTLIFEEVVKDAFSDGKGFTLRLPKGFKWNSPVANDKVDNSIDGRDLKLSYKNSNNDQMERIYFKVDVTVDRDAHFGDVNVTVNDPNNKISPEDLVIAEHVDYQVEITAEKVLEVVAGKDEQNEYEASINIKEKTANALVDNRYIEVSFVDKDGKEAPAAVQYGSKGVRIVKPGNGALKVENAGFEEKDNRVPDTMSNYSVEKVHVLKTWDLISKDGNNKKESYQMHFPFVVAAGFEGELYLKFNGAGIDNVTVKIADVKPAVTVEVAKSLSQVQIGLQRQEAADLVIKETVAGALQDYTEFGKKEALYTLKPAEEGWFKFKSVKGEVTEGNLSIDAVGLGGTKAVDKSRDKSIAIIVDRKSTKPSTIKLTGITVTLDRTIPYGDVKLNANFGQANGRHLLPDTTKSLDYFTTLTPVEESKRVVTVFKIGEKDYSIKTGKNVEGVSMDVAPYIKSGSTMLPVRYVGNALGARTEWNGSTREVTIYKDSTVVSLNVDGDTMFVNGSPVKLAQKPDVIDGRTFLPLKSIAQAFGLQTDVSIFWHAGNGTVTLLPQDATEEEKEAAKAGTILN